VPGTYTEFGSGESVTLEPDTRLSLPAWSFRIYVE